MDDGIKGLKVRKGERGREREMDEWEREDGWERMRGRWSFYSFSLGFF